MCRSLLVVVCLMLTAGCAARSADRAATETMARVAELVAEGCYDCLLEARQALSAMPAGARRAALVRMVEVELLLALRERELDLDAAFALGRARTLAGEFGGTDVDAVIALVENVPPDATGRRVLPPSGTARAELESRIESIARSPFSSLVKEYLALSARCGRLPLETDVAQPATDAALITYRRAICENPIDSEPLQTVRTRVPRFVEASFFLGRAMMGSLFTGDGRRAMRLLEEAFARFPDSPAIAFNLGTVYQATGDCRRAESAFSRALGVRGTHIEARLGRAVCRTYLSESAGAVADATVLIDAAASNRADAYYWRAWNRRQLKDLTGARADIDRSRALLYNARVLTLAGMIEYDQAEFDKAREDLTRASDMDARECQARWYLGLIGYTEEEWDESAAGFADSAECYAQRVRETEMQREAMEQNKDVSEEFRAEQLAGFDAAIAEDSTQKSAADLNAAINYARAGDIANATTYMKRAAVDPARQSMVEDLRQVLGVPRW